MSKNFKLTRKPGQNQDKDSDNNHVTLEDKAVRRDSDDRDRVSRATTTPRRSTVDDEMEALLTTRKTIEVPESYFYRVKMRALERKMKEKELWSEIVSEYFVNHPTK